MAILELQILYELTPHPEDDPYIPSRYIKISQPIPMKTSFLVVPSQVPMNITGMNNERPEIKDLVIYELLLWDFLSKHSYQTLIDTLDYLDRLGVTGLN